MSIVIKSYRDLVVWQKSMELCEMVYSLTAKLPANLLLARRQAREGSTLLLHEPLPRAAPRRVALQLLWPFCSGGRQASAAAWD